MFLMLVCSEMFISIIWWLLDSKRRVELRFGDTKIATYGVTWMSPFQMDVHDCVMSLMRSGVML